MAEPDAEYVDVNHPYMTDHKENEFVWGFDGEKAVEWALAIIGTIVDHAEHGGPQHAFDLMAIQAGITVADLPKDTQVPVLMMKDGSSDQEGFVPVAILLVAGDRAIDIAHTLGTLVDENGVHPALPSRGAEQFYNPPVVEEAPEPKLATTIFDLLASQREDKRDEDG